MSKQKVKKYANGGMAMMAPKFPSNFTPPAPGQTYINPNANPQMVNTLSSIASSLQNKGGNSFTPNIRREVPLPAPRPAALTGAARANLRPGPRFKSGGKVGSASKRADGIATKGKTKGRII